MNPDEQLAQIIRNQQEILRAMASTNSTIQQLATDFGKMQTDLTAFFAALGTFTTAVKAFVAAAASGSTGTTLSAADQATLQGLDTAATALDTQAQADAFRKLITPK